MADLSKQQIADIEARLTSIPPRTKSALSGGSADDLRAIRALGVSLPHDYVFYRKSDGSLGVKKESFLSRNEWFLPAALIGGGLIAGPGLGLLGGAGAGGGAAAVTAPIAAGGGGAAVATGAATGGSIWGTIGHGISRALPEIVAGTTGLIGAKMGANAAKDAAEIQAKANADALASSERIAQSGLDLESDIYKRRDAQLSPYRQTGNSALGSLNNLMGYPALTQTPVPEIRPVNIGATTTGGSLGSLNQTSTQPGSVRMKAPDNTIRLIPQEQVNAALAAGGQRV